MNVGYLSLTAAVVAVAFSSWSLFVRTPEKEVCFVRMAVIMEKYQGAVDATVKLRQRQQALQANVDSIISSIGGAGGEANTPEQQAQIESYVRAIEKRDEEERTTVSKQLISHVRTAVEGIAEQENLKIVIAITDENLLLYNDVATDVTEDVLRELKKNYRNEMRR